MSLLWICTLSKFEIRSGYLIICIHTLNTLTAKSWQNLCLHCTLWPIFHSKCVRFSIQNPISTFETNTFLNSYYSYWWLVYGEQGQTKVRKCVWDIFALMHCGLCLQLSFWWFHLCFLALAASHFLCSTLCAGYCLSLVLWDKQLSQVDWYENLEHKLCLHNDRGLMSENILLPRSLLL